MTIILATLLMTHLTIVSVTLYLHRCQAHIGVEFHPVLSHAMRFWLWLTTGMTTKQWVAVHRKHHQNTDVEGDTHSPHVLGIWNLVFGGVKYYNRAGSDYDTGLIHVTTGGTVTTGASAQDKTSGTLYWKILSSISGNYRYICRAHPGDMVGVITVKDINAI